MNTTFKPLGTSQEQLDDLIKFGLKYDKRQKKMFRSSTLKPATEKDMQTLETLAGFSFPADFRNFMLTQNGGIPEKSTIKGPNGTKTVLQKIYAISSNAPNLTVGHLLKFYKNRIPYGMFPFGDDPAGNLYLISLLPDDSYGGIFFWDHENEADQEKQPYFDNIHFICKSFQEFMKKLGN